MHRRLNTALIRIHNVYRDNTDLIRIRKEQNRENKGSNYGQEAARLLRDVTMYRALTKPQLLALYPGKKKKSRRCSTIWSGKAVFFMTAPTIVTMPMPR